MRQMRISLILFGKPGSENGTEMTALPRSACAKRNYSLIHTYYSMGFENFKHISGKKPYFSQQQLDIYQKIMYDTREYDQKGELL